MTKKDIAQCLSERLDVPLHTATGVFQHTLDAIVDILYENGRIELRNFGVFQLKQRAARIGRNPRTGEKVRIAPRITVTFKPGKEMDERIRRLDDSFNAANPVVDDESVYEDMDNASVSDDSTESE